MVEKVRPAVPASVSMRSISSVDDFERAVSRIDMDDIMEKLSGRLKASEVASFLEEEAAAREQIAALAHDFLRSERYRPLVEWLFDQTLRRQILPASGMSADQKLDYVCRREGENGLMYQLITAANEGGKA